MEEERIPKKVLDGNFHTTRPVGRPRTRWADVVQRDALQLLGIRGWRRRPANRDEWRPRPGMGCSAIDGVVLTFRTVLYTQHLSTDTGDTCQYNSDFISPEK
jgi:hypothetical protein